MVPPSFSTEENWSSGKWSNVPIIVQIINSQNQDLIRSVWHPNSCSSVGGVGASGPKTWIQVLAHRGLSHILGPLRTSLLSFANSAYKYFSSQNCKDLLRKWAEHIFVPHKDFASIRWHILHHHPTIDQLLIVFRIVNLQVWQLLMKRINMLSL